MFSHARVVMFDLDGTLVDTMGLLADLAAELLAESHGLPLDEARRLYLQTSGVPFAHQLDLLFPADARNEATWTRFEQRKRGICQQAELDAETRATLEALRAAGWRLVLSSNSAQHFVDAFAARCGVPFALALGFGNGLAKGAAHLTRVVDALDVPRDAIVFVGDSLRDGEIASASGVPFIGRLGTFDRACFNAALPGVPVIETLAELVPLLGAGVPAQGWSTPAGEAPCR